MATASQPSRRRLSRLLLVALGTVAAGCGGPSDDEQIESAVKRVMASASVKDQCETAVSERYVREVYVTLARCRGVAAPAQGDKARVFATRVDGDRASTGVTVTSARGARATGRVALVRVDSTWKVDQLGIDFLRSVFATLPKEGETAQERRILGCVAEATRGLPAADVRRIGNLVVGQRLTRAALPAAVVRCIRRGASRPGT